MEENRRTNCVCSHKPQIHKKNIHKTPPKSVRTCKSTHHTSSTAAKYPLWTRLVGFSFLLLSNSLTLLLFVDLNICVLYLDVYILVSNVARLLPFENHIPEFCIDRHQT